MPRKTKFVKGGFINDIGVLADEVRGFKGRYVYLRDRALHPAWVRCMSLEYLEHQIQAGGVRRAIERDTLVDVVCDHASECAELWPDCKARRPHLPGPDWGAREEDLCWELHEESCSPQD
jgi:hypothetical protein